MIILVVLFGLVIGSFLNVLIYRMPKEEEFVKSRSYCPSCHHQLGGLELIPVLSYLFLGGKCKHCRQKISPIYPIIELLNAVLYGVIYFRFGLGFDSLVYAIVSSILIVIAVIDYKHEIIPDELNAVLAILGVVLLWYNFSLLSLINSLLGLVTGGGLFLFIAVISKGAMGGGDIKLMAALGILFGIPGILIVAFFSFVVGAALSLILIAFKIKKMKDLIPFGPFIVLSAYINLFFGSQIISAYLNS